MQSPRCLTLSPLALAATVLGAALLSTPADAQTATLVRSQGVLGQTAQYDLSGTPGDFWILIPSLLPGPTPLSLFSPGDTRVLSVGLDQFPLWTGGFLDGGGNAMQTYPVPDDVVLQGLAAYAQFVTLPGNPFLVGDVSNPTGFVLGAPGTSTVPVGQPVEARTGQAQTVLPDGRVLISGGTVATPTGSVALDSLEIWDPQTGTFTALGATMSQERAAHTSTLLADGRVLLCGGGDTNGTITASCDLFDPATGLVTPAAPMSVPRTQHTATLLADGRVLVAGGTSDFDFSDITAALNAIHASAELYDPATDQWFSTGSLPKPRVVQSASLLQDGRVLVSGGVEVSFVFGIPFPAISSDCRVYQPGSGTWQSVGALPGERLAHPQLTLSDGRVLVAGGTTGDLLSSTFTPRSDTAVFDPVGNTWSAGPVLGSPRAYGQLVETSGQILLLQGLSTFDLATLSGTPVLDVETTDLSLSPWSIAGQALTGHVLGLSSLVDGATRVLTVAADATGAMSAEPYVR